jgi:hypothetical protein
MAFELPSKDWVDQWLAAAKAPALKWVQVVSNPASSIEINNGQETDGLLGAVRFMAFCTALSWLCALPAYYGFLKINLLEPTLLLVFVGKFYADFLIYAACFFLVSKILLSRAPLSSTLYMTAYLAAFAPFLYLANLFGFSNRNVIASIVGQKPSQELDADFFIAAFIMLAIFIYIAVKCIPLLRKVYGFGIVRASLCLVAATLLTWIIEARSTEEPLLKSLSPVLSSQSSSSEQALPTN